MGREGHLALVSICAVVSIYSYKLTVPNGREGGPFAFSIYVHCPICAKFSVVVL